MATKAQVDNFIKRIAPIAVEQAKKHDNKIFPSVCIAQAGCESSWGTSPKMKNANAVFGIKVGKSKWHFGTAWKDEAYSTKTKEFYNGKYHNITDYFRAYNSISDAVEDYYDMLCTASRYRFALNQPNPLECIKGIQKAPYATSPTYVQTIMNIINKYDLQRYDVNIKVDNPYKLTATLLKIGNRSESVKWVQYQLNKVGYNLKVDGIYGKKTAQAISDFQSKSDGLLKVDGICGKNTFSALSSV